MGTRTLWAYALVGAVFAGACSGQAERAARQDLRASVDRVRGPDRDERPTLDGSLEAYVAYATFESPELTAALAAWEASVLRASPARRPPPPQVSYTYYARSVETRVGPQRHRLGVRQRIPWPSALTAASEAQAELADAGGQAFEAALLDLRRRVGTVYWRLWLIHRDHRIKLEQEELLTTLVQSVRARVETGASSVGDLLQAELALARHLDHHKAHREARVRAEAELRALIGAPPRTPMPIKPSHGPPGGLPRESFLVLRKAALEHPRIGIHEALTDASRAMERREHAARLPSFEVGFDWIATGEAREARMAGVQGSGKDPLLLTVGMALPLWGASYGAAERAAGAERRRHKAEGENAQRLTEAELEGALADVRDADRRIHLYADALIPQAQATFESILGSLSVGRATLAQALLAERELLSLTLALAEARADHAMAWTLLEHVAGRPVKARHTDTEAP